MEDEDEHEAEEDEEEDNWSRSTETDAYSPLPVRNEYACPPHTTRHRPNITPPEEEEDPELDRGCVMFAACHICAVSRNST